MGLGTFSYIYPGGQIVQQVGVKSGRKFGGPMFADAVNLGKKQAPPPAAGVTQTFGGSVSERVIADPDIVTEGLRLTGTPQQISVLGKQIPRVYGTYPVDGNIIWATPIRETLTETLNTTFETEINSTFEDQLSELGDTDFVFFDVVTTVEHTTITKTFEVHAGFAVALCQGPIEGVGRIWANGSIIYDFRADNFNAGTRGTNVRIHLGDETQLPDPLIKISQGAADTPAFRGLAYVVFDDLDLEPYGNIIPNIVCEVVTNPSEEFPFDTIVSSIGRGTPTTVHARTALTIVKNAEKLAIIDHRSKTVLAAGTVTGASGVVGGSNVPTLDHNGVFLYEGGSGENNDPILKINSFSLAVVAEFGIYSGLDGATSTIAINRMIAYRVEPVVHTFVDKSGVEVTVPWELIACHARVFKQVAWLDPHDMTMLGKVGAGQPEPFGTLLVENGWSAIGPGFRTYTVAADATTLKIFVHRILDPRPLIGDTPNNILLERTVDLSADFADDSTSSRIQWIETRQAFAVAKGDEVLLWHPVDGVVETKLTPFGLDEGWWHSGPANDGLWAMRGPGDVIRVLNILNWTLAAVPDSMDDWVDDDYSHGGGYDPVMRACIAQGTVDIRVLYKDRLGASGGVSLASVVSAECVEAGLAAGDIDVSELTGETVRGFIIDHLAPAREGLEVLSQLFFFDAVEVDGKINFPFRAAVSVGTVASDDLGVEVEQALDEGRLMEQELPLSVSVTYLSKEAEYQPAVQTEQRISEAVNTREVVNIKANIVFSEDEARQIAQKFMLLTWEAQRTFGSGLGRKHARFDPGDVITITKDGVSHLVRLLITRAGPEGSLEFEGESADPAALVSTVSGRAVGTRLGRLDEIVRSQGFLFDLPMLRDSDDNVGPYIAAAPERSVAGWRGSNVYVGEGGPAFDLLDTVGNAAVWGRAMGALADQLRWTVFDRTSTLTVAWINGIADLASVTEIDVLNGKNGFVVGDEIIQAASVVDNGDGTVTLSTLLRGRNGTDFAVTGHAVGEAVIFLTNLSPHKLVQDKALIGVERFFRFDTVGTSKVNSKIIAFADTGRAKKPYSPANVRGSRDGSENLIIKWNRRCRFPTASAWLDDVDVPLGEDTEVYEADILIPSGSGIRKVTGLTTETTTYSKTDQDADGIESDFTFLWGHTLTNADAETGDMTGWTAALGLNNMAVSSGVAGWPVPFEGTYSFIGGLSGESNNATEQEVDLVADGVDTGLVDDGQFQFRVRAQRAIGDTPDEVEFQLRFKDVNKIQISIAAEGLVVPSPVDTYALAEFIADIPANTRFVDVILHAKRQIGSFNSGTFDKIEAITGVDRPGIGVEIFQMSDVVGRGFGRLAIL